MQRSPLAVSCLIYLLVFIFTSTAAANDPWLVFQGEQEKESARENTSC